MRLSLKKTITLEIEVDVEGKFYRAEPGSFYRTNGDPGEPPEPANFVIANVYWQRTNITKLLDESGFDFYELEEQCIEEIENKELDIE